MELDIKGFVEKWFTLDGCKSGEIQVSVQCLAALSRLERKNSIKRLEANIANIQGLLKEPFCCVLQASVQVRIS